MRLTITVLTLLLLQSYSALAQLKDTDWAKRDIYQVTVLDKGDGILWFPKDLYVIISQNDVAVYDELESNWVFYEILRVFDLEDGIGAALKKYSDNSLYVSHFSNTQGDERLIFSIMSIDGQGYDETMTVVPLQFNLKLPKRLFKPNIGDN